LRFRTKVYVSTVPLSLTVTLQVRAPEVGRVHLAALTTAFFAAFVSVTANVAVDEVNAPLYRLATAGLNGELILAPFSVMLETISGTEIVNGALGKKLPSVETMRHDPVAPGQTLKARSPSASLSEVTASEEQAFT
jgi:hypothetical protein